MRVRARARQRGVELPLVISDHCDWDGLTSTIAATGHRRRILGHLLKTGLSQKSIIHHKCVR